MIRDRLDPVLEEKLQGTPVVRAQETSFLGLKPGDLVQFSYQKGASRGFYSGLVVASKKTGAGCIRLSTRNNTLINIITVDGLSQTSFNFMINRLYNNWTLSKYPNKGENLARFSNVDQQGMNALKEIFNEDNFKTFIVHQMYDIKVISL